MEIEIRNSRDFSYAPLKSQNEQTTTTNMANKFVSLMPFGIIKHLLTEYSGNSKLIISETTNGIN